MAGTVEERPKASEKGKKVRRQRVGVRIDMTPMVDVAFLLLIFFMVTTVFRLPQAMEINMPERDVRVEVPESNVMTVFIDKDNSMYYRTGSWPLSPLPWEELPLVLEDNFGVNPDLVVLTKIHREATYENMVNMMDALADAHINRFSVIPMKEEDSQLLLEAQ